MSSNYFSVAEKAKNKTLNAEIMNFGGSVHNNPLGDGKTVLTSNRPNWSFPRKKVFL